MNGRPARRPHLISTALVGAVLAGCAGAAGYYGSSYVAPALFAGVLKYAIGIVGVVWLFSLTVYNKLSDVTDMPGLDYQQHRNLEVEIRTRLSWFWMRALFLAFVALFMYAPSILQDAKMPIPPWAFGAACAALLLALFSLRRLWHELEEIRELRSHIKEMERRESERTAQVKALKDGMKDAWEPDERLSGFRGASRNDGE